MTAKRPTRRRIAALALTASGFALGGCSSISASSDFYSGADFTGYSRYAWISDMPFIVPAGYEIAVSPLNQRRIKEAVESELAVKGFERVDDRERADFSVSLTVGTRDRIDVDAYPPRYRGQWEWPWGENGVEVDSKAYTEGILSIDVFDETTRQPVWHGWARKRITNSDLENAGEQIQAAVKAIFREFPPPASTTRD